MAAERKLKIVFQAKDETAKPVRTIRKRLRDLPTDMGVMRKRMAMHLRDIRRNLGQRLARAAQFAASAIKKALLAAALAVAAAFVAMARTVKQQFAEIDKLAKTATRFGVAIENMRGLQLAAKLGGIELTALNNIIRDTSRRTSEAAQGTGEAAGAIRELGLNAEALNKLRPEEQLDTILGALRNVENQNDRVRLAYDTMGRSGTEALTLLGGSLRSARLEAELLTGTITPQLAKDIQDANDDVARMKMAWNGVGQTIAGQVADAVSSVAKMVKNGLIQTRIGFEVTFKSGELLFKEMIASWRLEFVSFSRLLRDTPLADMLLGGQLKGILGFMEMGGRSGLRQIREELDHMARLQGDLPDIVGGLGGGGLAGIGQRPQLPGVQSGRLITGGAAAGADRIRQMMAEAERARRADAERQRKLDESRNDLLREFVQSLARGGAPAAGIR